MKTLRRFIALSLFLSLLHSVAQATDAPTLNGILQKHLEAMGGLNNWNRIESIQFNGTIERNGQTVGVVIVKKRPNQIRATVTVPIPGIEGEAFQIIRAHDGKSAWTATRRAGAPEMRKEELPQDAATELQADAGVLPLLIKFWREGADLKLSGSEFVDGHNHYIIHATGEDLTSEYTFYLDAETYLVTHYDCAHPTNGVTRTALGDYTETHNVLIPMHNATQTDRTGQSVMTTDAIKIGVGIYREYFQADNPSNTAKL